MDPSQLPIVQPDAAQVEENLRQIQQQFHVANRQCGECTACCTFMVVNELQKPAKVPCPNCSAAGCAIYETRPLSCRGWACEWWTGRFGLTEAQRPDKLGLMVSVHAQVRSSIIVNELWPGAAMTKAALRVLDRLKAQHRVFFVPANGTGFGLGQGDTRREIELAGFPEESHKRPLEKLSKPKPKPPQKP